MLENIYLDNKTVKKNFENFCLKSEKTTTLGVAA